MDDAEEFHLHNQLRPSKTECIRHCETALIPNNRVIRWMDSRPIENSGKKTPISIKASSFGTFLTHNGHFAPYESEVLRGWYIQFRTKFSPRHFTKSNVFDLKQNRTLELLSSAQCGKCAHLIRINYTANNVYRLCRFDGCQCVYDKGSGISRSTCSPFSSNRLISHMHRDLLKVYIGIRLIGAIHENKSKRKQRRRRHPHPISISNWYQSEIFSPEQIKVNSKHILFGYDEMRISLHQRRDKLPCMTWA